MKNQSPTTAIILDTRYQKEDKTFPAKLRITYNREYRKYGTAFSFTEKDFEKIIGEKPREPYKTIRLKLDAVEKNAREIIKELQVFSFDAFAVRYSGKVGEPSNVFSAFQTYIDQMNEAGRVGNAIAYSCALKSIQEFSPKTKLLFDDIDSKFLYKYEKWSTDKGNSLTTVGIYLRCLRSLYNQAIINNGVKAALYPFRKHTSEKNKYQIPSPQNIKKALTLSDIKKIFKFHSNNNKESLYHDLWKFSYLCNGANMKDICLLRYNDISENTIQFRRAKTTNTNRSSKPISVGYSDHLKQIVELL